MNRAEKAACPHLYRKHGAKTVHCRIQAERGGKWDFCKYQYLCQQTGRYETTQEALTCSLRQESKGGNR